MTKLKLMFVLAVSFTAAVFAGAAAAKHLSDKNVKDRLEPVHKVYVEGDDVPQVSNAAPTTAATSGPRAPEDIYNTYCSACHVAGVAGAPKLGDVAAWDSRLANGIETVYSNAINGINAMPPKGTCSDCSDDEIKAVVDYMVEQSK
ncbi:c-type cytochrome [Kangiella sediminilitoris]|uniref:Cytochrome C n=1 Tax=Kangiella sediminilitoris TaxID=1144748 RepID=A0A1B3BDR7_9GAMM|nr:cytochrome c5 family protein [Kangiella sediminilitoris]AOE50903.1 cytochrome C [Kangiella sediminilitoris]